MGQVYQAVNLKETLKRFNIKNFVETGSGIGDTLTELLIYKPHPIEIYTIELMDELHDKLMEKFGDIPYVHLIKGYSHEQVPNVVNMLSKEPTLFWHDAHFPGADFGIGGATYTSEPDPTKRIPLHEEMLAVKNSGRDISRDVIIADDLWVYKDGDFEAGNWPLRSVAGGDGIDFVYDLFGDTHHIFETNTKQGFMILFPKENFTEDMKALIL